MAYNIGLNVVEVDGGGAPAIRGAATSVGAFNVLTERGVPNRPARVTSFAKFVEQFGSYYAGGLGAYLVRGFFDNGGQTLYVNRVAPADAVVASQVLSDGANDTLRLEAGFRGQEDPGAWADNLYARIEHTSSATAVLQEETAASLTGNVLADPTDMTSAADLEVLVDGATVAAVIPFPAASFAGGPAAATPAEIRDAINGAGAGLEASIAPGGELVLTSTGETAGLEGTWSALEIVAAPAPFGLAAGTADQGTPAALTAATTRVRQADAFAVGDAVQVSDGVTTETVTLVRVDEDTGELEWTPDLAAPGAYTAVDVTLERLEFDLTLARGGVTDEYVVETWAGLSMQSDTANYVETVLNDELRGSKYVVATDEGSASGPGADRPAEQDFTRFAPGANGTATVGDFVGDPAARSGFYAFDPFDVQLVVCERSDATVVRAALDYCAGRGDCMFIGAVPEAYVEAGLAVSYGQQFQGKKVYGALYGPYIKIFDPAATGENPVRFVPPQGHVAGVYARIETTRGIHKAPAGDEASVAGALDVAYRLTQAEHDDLVRNGGVNGVRVVPGSGVVVDASRTLSTDTRWLYVNVRLLFNYVKTSLLQGLSWVRQEPNRDTLWSLVKHNSVVPFLMGLYRQGAFGTGEPDEVFTVICDASNNPPEEVDQGLLRIEVYFYPSRPAETVVIIVGQQPSGGSVSEA